MNKAYVFIDGQYLSLISKVFGHGKHMKIDIEKFSHIICGREGYIYDKIYYYTAPPFQSAKPTSDEAFRKTNYDKFINKLHKSRIIVREGRCQKINNEYIQKGVDTLMTMDLMLCSQTIIIIACDTDFVPVLKEIRNKGVKIILYYYSDFKRYSMFSMSNYLFTVCDKKVLIDMKLMLESLQS
jgi:uncharacterized LabA/DUF88 family protein